VLDVRELKLTSSRQDGRRTYAEVTFPAGDAGGFVGGSAAVSPTRCRHVR
jgi:hypothetical protein